MNIVQRATSSVLNAVASTVGFLVAVYSFAWGVESYADVLGASPGFWGWVLLTVVGFVVFPLTLVVGFIRAIYEFIGANF